ncbi:MAG: hypothetical protein M3R24_20845 [Chloroflexota bacterium]|nr:hypothetical protein [Chloroflexota bacterium]
MTDLASPERNVPAMAGLSRRSAARELLDAPIADDTELRENLDDIYRLNRLTGTTTRLVRQVVGLLAGVRGTATVLDVGTGSGISRSHWWSGHAGSDAWSASRR